MARKSDKTLNDILNDDTLEPILKYTYYIKTSPEWKRTRDFVLLRDNYSCLCCGRTQAEIDEYNLKKGKRLLSLVVHHRCYDSLFSEAENNYRDLITVCSACHRAIHSAPSNRLRFKMK